MGRVVQSRNYTEYSTFYQINKEIEDDPRCKTNAAKRQIARFVELHETNIAQRIEVIVEHFRTTVMHELGGQAKAMVITASRQAAVKYRQAFEDYITKKGYEGIHALEKHYEIKTDASAIPQKRYAIEKFITGGKIANPAKPVNGQDKRATPAADSRICLCW